MACSPHNPMPFWNQKLKENSGFFRENLKIIAFPTIYCLLGNQNVAKNYGFSENLKNIVFPTMQCLSRNQKLSLLGNFVNNNAMACSLHNPMHF